MNTLVEYFNYFTENGYNEEVLESILHSYKSNTISISELQFLYDINYSAKNKILMEEKLAITDSLIISIVREEGRNQGYNETSYFKVYRAPSKGSANDDCLRISLFSVAYELGHIHTYKKLLDKGEKETLVGILNSIYTPNSSKQQEMTQYAIMSKIYNDELKKYYEDKSNHSKLNYPKVPTVWIALLHYFNFVNNGKHNVSLLTLMPNYLELPTKI